MMNLALDEFDDLLDRRQRLGRAGIVGEECRPDALEPMPNGEKLKAWREALARYGTPEIFSTDQGAQSTALMLAKGVGVSMDARRWIDNVYV